MSASKDDDPKKNPKRALGWRNRQRLDGKPRLPRGRHAKARTDDDEPPRERRAVPIHQRLGFRPAEFAALIGVSYVTVWRGIRAGKIRTIDHCGVTIIPRAYALEAGFITADDDIT
jgi:hypothetical protein